MNETPDTEAGSPAPDAEVGRREYRLVVHLYRQYELPVVFSAESAVLTGAMQSRLMLQVQDLQTDYLGRIGQLRHNYTNLVRLITNSSETTNHRGTFQHSLGWYQSHRPEFYERFKQLLLDIRNLLPSLPMTALDGIPEELAERIRRFETEANAVIVQPARDMALKVLTHALVGEGLLTEQAMLVHFDLREQDFTRPGFSKVIARVIQQRQRLYFRKRVPDALLTGNINVLQGQLDGHCSHLLSLLTSRDMSKYVQSTLRAIRFRHLPAIMARVLKRLDSLDRHRAAIYVHDVSQDRTGARVSLKDLMMREATVVSGSLADAAAAIEPFTRAFDPADPDNADVQVVETRVVAGGLQALEALYRFGIGVSDLPADELDRKITCMRHEFTAAIDPCIDLLAGYLRVQDQVEEAVRPLLGLISFDSGGQSDFYARWFPGLSGLLERDGRIEPYMDALRRLQRNRDEKPVQGDVDREAALQQALGSWLTPEALARIKAESAHGRALPKDDIIAVLASTCALVEALVHAPDWFRELEVEIFHAIEEKKQQARRVIAASQAKGPGS